MIYRFGITTPANTTEDNKQKTVLLLAKGVIHQLDIDFPPGPSGLAHIEINRALHQVWPTNPAQNFAGDNVHISFHEHFELKDEPLQLEAYTWNEDTAHEHTITIRIGLLPSKFLLRRIF